MTKNKAHLAAFSANLIYGANFSIAKLIMPGMIRPNAFILLRVVFATALFFSMYRLTKTSEKIERSDYFRFFLLGLLVLLSINYFSFKDSHLHRISMLL